MAANAQVDNLVSLLDGYSSSFHIWRIICSGLIQDRLQIPDPLYQERPE